MVRNCSARTGIEATPERGSIDASWIGACAVCKPLVHMDDRAQERQFGAEQPVGPLRWTEDMGAHQTVSPIDAIYRIVFRVSGVEEPQHALESPSRIRRGRVLAPILLVSARPVGRVDCEPRGHTDGVWVVFKCAHTCGQAPRLQPIVGADPAKERAARGLEHAPHVLVRTDVDLIGAQPDAPVGTRVIVEHLDRSVIRGVVADNELEIGEVLRQDRFDAPLDDIPAVSYGEPDRKRWRALTHRNTSESAKRSDERA